MKIRSKIFQSSFRSWKSLREEAAEFANQIPSENLISISHSCDYQVGSVIVWYRAKQTG